MSYQDNNSAYLSFFICSQTCTDFLNSVSWRVSLYAHLTEFFSVLLRVFIRNGSSNTLMLKKQDLLNLMITCSSLSTTVKMQCTFQRGPWWFIDNCRHHISWSTQTVLLHYCSYLSHGESENCLVSTFHGDIIPLFSVFNILFESSASIKPKENIFYKQ